MFTTPAVYLGDIDWNPLRNFFKLSLLFSFIYWVVDKKEKCLKRWLETEENM